MADNDFAKNLLNARGRRAMATLLTSLERLVKPEVEPEVWEQVRGVVLTVISDYQDLAMDMIAAETGIINEFWAEKLDEIHAAVKAIDRG